MAQTKKNGSKRSSTSSSRSKKSSSKGNSGDRKVFWSALLLITGILILAFTLITGESVWYFIHNTLLGAFGVAVVLVPIVLIYASVMIGLDKEKDKVIGKVLQGAVLVILVCAAAQIFSDYTIDRSLALSKIADDLMENGKQFKGGGIFSVAVGIPLLMAFGKIGAGIIIVLAVLFFVLLLANKTVIDVFRMIGNAFAKMRDARPEYVETEVYIPENKTGHREKAVQQSVDIPLPSHAVSQPLPAKEKNRRKKAGSVSIPVPAVQTSSEPAVPNSDVPGSIARKAQDSFDIDIPIHDEMLSADVPNNFAKEKTPQEEIQYEVESYRKALREQQARKKKKISIADLPFSLDPIGSDKDPKEAFTPQSEELFSFLDKDITSVPSPAVKETVLSDENDGSDGKKTAALSPATDAETVSDAVTEDENSDSIAGASHPAASSDENDDGRERMSLSKIIEKAAMSAGAVSKAPSAAELSPVREIREAPKSYPPVSAEKKIIKTSSLASNKIGDDEDLDLPETTAQDIQEEIAENSREVIEYTIPPIELLKKSTNDMNVTEASAEMRENADILLKTLESFGIAAEIVNINRGPSVTRYELLPKAGIKLSKIRSLADDIALRLAAMGGIRIEAPIPGKAAVGIEVPNRVKDVVTLRDVLDTKEFANNKSKLTFAVGKNIDGDIILGDIASLPHIIIAGTTGSGKSVCTNGIIMSILYNATPEEVRLVLIDPKMVEFKIYNGIPHLLLPVVTDPRKAAGALSWAVQEMLKRYKLFSDNSVRDLNDYNELARTRDDLDTIPRIVIVIDELADLMMAAKSEVEDSICRLAQMARAAGMHLIIATQRPTVDVVTGLIKSNIPSRIALRVASGVDSRTILDEVGAEKLLGNGDLLYFPTGFPKPLRVQNSYTSSKEVAAVVDFIKNGAGNVVYDEDIIKAVEENIPAVKGEKTSTPADNKTYEGSDEEKLDLAIECCVDSASVGVSVTYLQKKLKLGYARASRIMDELEDMGVVGPPDGAKPRRVLMSPEMYAEYKLSHMDDDTSAE